MGDHCFLYFTGKSSFTGFLDGAKWISSIHSMVGECVCYSPTAESFGVSAQLGPGVRGSAEGRFHEGFTRVPRDFHEVLRGLRGGACTQESTACCWGYHLSLLFNA